MRKKNGKLRETQQQITDADGGPARVRCAVLVASRIGLLANEGLVVVQGAAGSVGAVVLFRTGQLPIGASAPRVQHDGTIG